MHLTRHIIATSVLAGAILAAHAGQPAADAAPPAPLVTIDIPAPAGSGAFGDITATLPNGNIVVTDPLFDTATAVDVGSVSLYDGTTLDLIGRVTGSTANDHIGNGGFWNVGDTNFIIRSPEWDGAQPDVGAVTFFDGDIGVSGDVSASNSLVGTATNDLAKGPLPLILANGNYIVGWRVSAMPAGDRSGAFTFGDGSTGVTGELSDANSVVGAAGGGGGSALTALADGNAVLVMPQWDGRGAARWISGTTPTVGPLSALNSIVAPVGTPAEMKAVGLADGDYVVSALRFEDATGAPVGATTWAPGGHPTGSTIDATNSILGAPSGGIGAFVVALTNGNYVVASPIANGRGSVTLASGAGPSAFTVSATNSLVGTRPGDGDALGVAALANGNYVVNMPYWDDGPTPDVGAAIWANGETGVTADVSHANSLYGSTPGDGVGQIVVPLATGHYALAARRSDAGGVDSGAVVLGNGATGTTGAITVASALVGGATNAGTAMTVTPLTNGNAVVAFPYAIGGAGAVTLVRATNPPVGPVSVANSLVGSSPDDLIFLTVVALTDGNAVVGAPRFSNSAGTLVGSATWIDGSAGTAGRIGEVNSLLGAATDDYVGYAIAPLSGGRYAVSGVVASPTATAAGSVTIMPAGGLTGVVGSSNSLVGATINDQVGGTGAGSTLGSSSEVADVLVVRSPRVDNGGATDVGAISIIGAGLPLGAISDSNTVFGRLPGTGGNITPTLRFTSGNGLVVSQPQDNRVTVISVPDTKPPALQNVPADVVVDPQFGSTDAVVTFTPPAAIDARDGSIAARCDPPSGSRFPIGTTTVVCEATDRAGLTATASFTVTVRSPAPKPPPPSPTPDYVPLVPARLVDTREHSLTVDGVDAGQGVRERGATTQLRVAGRGGVATDAVAVALNVTAVDARGSGFITVFPCGSPRPLASHVNFAAGATVPNAVLAKTGDDGSVCIFTSQPTGLVVDVDGYFPVTSTYVPVNPQRVLDTRPTEHTSDGQQQGNGIVPAGSTTELQIAGRAGIPPDTTSVALNVTVAESEAAGYVTVYPCGTDRPTASSLNAAGGDVANLVVARLGTSGKVCLFNQTAMHLVADVNGWFPTASTYAPLTPDRLLDTRLGNGSRVAAGSVTELRVTGNRSVPTSAGTVVLNVTVTEPAAGGFVTVFPCGVDRPLASNLNYVSGQTVPNAVLVEVGSNGSVCLYSSEATHLVVDANGTFPG